MYDLIYCGDREGYREIWDIIKEEFPDALLGDGSDFIHEHRFSVSMKGESIEDEEQLEKDFIKFAIKQGFYNCSLNVQSMMLGVNSEVLLEILAEIKEEKEEE